MLNREFKKKKGLLNQSRKGTTLEEVDERIKEAFTIYQSKTILKPCGYIKHPHERVVFWFEQRNNEEEYLRALKDIADKHTQKTAITDTSTDPIIIEIKRHEDFCYKNIERIQAQYVRWVKIDAKYDEMKQVYSYRIDNCNTEEGYIELLNDLENRNQFYESINNPKIKK